MSIIREAALSAFFEVLFEMLTSSDVLKIFKQERLHADLKKWKTMLLKIRSVLDDAEEKQMTSKLVKFWLDELEDLAYDADDILDECATEAVRRKVNAEAATSKVRKFIPTYCAGFNPSSVIFDANMRSKIEEIDARLQRIVTEMNGLGLIENTGRRTTTTRSWVPTTSLVNEGHVYGRDEDKKAIVKLLLSRELGDAQLSVISTLGMGGLGKTTLAQLVYNDVVVSRYFDLKAWACVSDDFDIVRVTKVILKSLIAPEIYDVNDLNLLQEKLFGRKFLFILDDVWNEDYDNWTKLRSPFEFGALGSKIIVTTRNHGVSSTIGTTPTYELKVLSNNDCWRIFTQHALGATSFTMHPELEEIGRKILCRCKGSPLAAKVLGGLLRTTHNHDEWKNVLHSKIWDIPEEKSNILSILKLSYKYLSSRLKRCSHIVHYSQRIMNLRKKSSSCYGGQKTLILKGCSHLTMLPKKFGNLVNLRHLDILDVNSIKEMPVGIEELKSLQTLSNFFVGKDTGSKIGDLMNLEFLQGRLCISNLENVLDVENARKANLNGKKSLDALVMKWEVDDLQDGTIAVDVLNMLKPHRTVKTLFIEGYAGVNFPMWLRDPSFPNMVELRVDRCGKCVSLPAVGQLPILKYLIITRMAKVQRLGPEFYGKGCLKSFQSLETLRFEDMQEWQDWIPCKVDYEEFPCLHELSISQCPKL
ncbi:hypothetical protein SO802_008303 [Lithocarpus litseifolius]|uniref:Disease resistance RPP13-like protein 1 n=1 Tax=Lithocarpus litseifolius TaxID=425828 RepID=A0AAW2DDR7_9ROSI